MSRAQTSFALLLLPLLSIAACQRPAPERTATTDTVVFTGFTLIDGTGRPAAPNSAMTIEEGRVRWVGPVAELKALAQAKPDSLNFATLGDGSFPDLFLRWMNNQWNTKIVGVPYRGGGPAAQALAANDVQLTRFGVGNFTGLLLSCYQHC